LEWINATSHLLGGYRSTYARNVAETYKFSQAIKSEQLISFTAISFIRRVGRRRRSSVSLDSALSYSGI
jgi:hypothetical protein